MIRNQWYVVLESKEVKQDRPTGVTRMGEKLVFWRRPNREVVCMFDRCPHLGAPLSLGKIKDDRIACPFHGFEYSHQGRCQYLPAYGKNGKIPLALKTRNYRTYEAHGFIWIWWGENPPENLESPEFFDSINDEFSYISFIEHWGVHYSRMAENQLDVSHLPFIHYNTIGRGNKTVVDGPYVKLVDDLMEIWVQNREDDGTPPIKAKDLPEPTRRPFLQFRFPNLWHNWISDDIRVLAAFVPVDEENGIFYGRFYQKITRVPIIKQLLLITGKIGSQVIAGQDKHIVTHQEPKKSGLKIGEKIMQSDHAILTYRLHRSELKALARQGDLE